MTVAGQGGRGSSDAGRRRPEIGICLAALADWALPDALAQVRDLGLSLVDLPTDSVYRVATSCEEDLRPLLERFGIRVACVSNSRDAQLVLGPYGPHTDPIITGGPAHKRQHGLRHAHRAIALAGAVGAPQVRLLLGCPDLARWLRWPDAAVSWQDNVDEYVAVAGPLALQAEQLGVQLCIEPHVKQVPYDAASLRACMSGLRRVGADPGVCFDPANLAALHHDPAQVLAALDLVPVCVHAKDIELSQAAEVPSGPGWVAYGPHPAIRFRAAGSGQLDWWGLLGRLVALGYAGPILIEHEDLVGDRLDGIESAHRHLVSMLDRVVADAPGPGQLASSVSTPSPGRVGPGDPSGPARDPWW